MRPHILLLFLLVGYVACDPLLPSAWSGTLLVRNLTRVRYDGGMEDEMDRSFDSEEQPPPQIKRRFIDLLPVSSLDADAASVGDGRNKTAWAFMAVVIIPPLSCESMNKVACLFDVSLQHANPEVQWVGSTAVRFGSDACEDGVCPCTKEGSTTARYATRVLELETLCGINRLALPADDEFPFVYDARTAVSYPKRKKRGRRLDVGGDDDVISHLMSMAESVFLLFTASVNSSTLVSQIGPIKMDSAQLQRAELEFIVLPNN